ncbi:hypothetical protein BGZ57DRAFT_984338, partial [Hyaloscypha finlandica]
SSTPSLNCTLASSLPPDSDSEDDEEQLALPSYNEMGGSSRVEELGSHRTQNSGELSSTPGGASINVSRQYSLGPVKRAEDDNTLCTQPSIQVDYLSHTWREEDVWSSWKHVVLKKGVYSNSTRLENASWRAWAKLKNKSKTISAKTLNWQALTLRLPKDCDVTWLYGPLYTGSNEGSWTANTSSYGSSRTSSLNSSLHKKSILKKRSISKTIPRILVSAPLLFRQDTAAVQVAQYEGRSNAPLLGAATPGHVRFQFSLRRMNSSTLRSTSSSWATLSTGEKKSIQFDEQVQQCIAVDMEEGIEEWVDPYAVNQNDFDSGSNDSGIMMKPTNSKGKVPAIFGKKTISRDRLNVDGKTIMILPATNLNSGEDLQRTRSGILTPYEDDEDDVALDGLSRKVIETANSAEDVESMAWNVC